MDNLLKDHRQPQIGESVGKVGPAEKECIETEPLRAGLCGMDIPIRLYVRIREARREQQLFADV